MNLREQAQEHARWMHFLFYRHDERPKRRLTPHEAVRASGRGP